MLYSVNNTALLVGNAAFVLLAALLFLLGDQLVDPLQDPVIGRVLVHRCSLSGSAVPAVRDFAEVTVAQCAPNLATLCAGCRAAPGFRPG